MNAPPKGPDPRGAAPAGPASGSIDRPRRRWLGRFLAAPVLAPLAGGSLLLTPGRPAFGHHGFAKVYDFSRPLYLAGTIDAIWIGLPHARLRLRLDRPLVLPGDRERYRALEDAEARQMLGRLRLPDERGTVDVVLHARLTRALMADPDALTAGMPTEIIGYRRTTTDEYRGEILGVLVRLGDGRMLVASAPPSPPTAAQPAAPSPSGSSSR